MRSRIKSWNAVSPFKSLSLTIRNAICEEELESAEPSMRPRSSLTWTRAAKGVATFCLRPAPARSERKTHGCPLRRREAARIEIEIVGSFFADVMHFIVYL